MGRRRDDVSRRNDDWLEIKELTGWTYRRLARSLGVSLRTIKGGCADARHRRETGGAVPTLDPALRRYVERQSRYRDDPAVAAWLLEHRGPDH